MTPQTSIIGDSERWLSVLAGGMLALSSLRRRDVGVGALFAIGGAALIYRGVTGHDGLFDALGDSVRRELAGDRPAGGGGAGEPVDEVEEASMESFPASDPPSWTPTAGAEVDTDEGGEGAEDES